VPAWVRAITHVNPLSYEVNDLRQLLLDLTGPETATGPTRWPAPVRGAQG
jgi:hypothetical protein